MIKIYIFIAIVLFLILTYKVKIIDNYYTVPACPDTINTTAVNNLFNNVSSIVSTKNVNNVSKEQVSDQLEHYMKNDSISHYNNNDLLSGVLKLQSLKYSTPKDKPILIDFIDPSNKKNIKLYADKNLPSPKFVDNSHYLTEKRNELKMPKEFYELHNDCKDKSIRRCKLPPMNSTRCFLNECELSTYNQCTNNVINQNSCECRVNDLCKEPDKLRDRCYRQRYSDCMNNSINKYR